MKDGVLIELDGKDGALPAEVFLSTCRELLLILKNVDTALSRQASGTLSWTVEGLNKQSPATMLVRPRLKPKMHYNDMLKRVPQSSLEGLELLEQKPSRPKPFADETLKHVRTLGSYYKRQLNKCTISFNDITVNVTTKSVANIDILTGEEFEAYGSVTGNMESVTIHRGNEFRIWEEMSGYPVRCRFAEEQFEMVKSALGHRVTVEGVLKSNALGHPISILVENLEACPREEDLPSIEDISGLVPDLTGALSLREYMKALRDD